MNQTHLPRLLIILLFILVAATFFVGTLLMFAPAQAATVLEDRSHIADLSSTDKDLPQNSTSIADFPPPGLTPTPHPVTLLEPPTDDTIYADTTGIIALAILMVVVVLVGLVLGGGNPLKNKEPTK